MGDDDDGVLLLQLHSQILNPGGGNGVKGRGGLVHEQHRGLHRQGSGDAEPLLLTAGHAQGVLFQPVLHLVPDGRSPESLLRNLVQLGPIADAMGSGAVGDVVVNAHGEGIGLLENHADLLAQAVDLRVEDVLPLVFYFTGDFHAGNQVVHPVQGFQEGGLAAARGADQGGDGLFRNVQLNVVQGLGLTVPEIHVPDGNNRLIHNSLLILRSSFDNIS